uniref:transposase n=1 Tax=Erwinia pyrifoliae TaxID=79967 RepID=UPI003F68B73A
MRRVSRRWTARFYLYASATTTREIVATFRGMYDADVSPTLIAKVADAGKGPVAESQARPLDELYPIDHLDCIVVRVRHGGSEINKAVCLDVGLNAEGQKGLLGMWLAENEGAKFWLRVLTELKIPCLQDVLIAVWTD